VVSDINLAFSKSDALFVYVVLARDWRNLKKISIKDTFPIDFEKTYPGVTILKISNSRKAHDPAGAL
jgi:hypothetical protein